MVKSAIMRKTGLFYLAAFLLIAGTSGYAYGGIHMFRKDAPERKRGDAKSYTLKKAEQAFIKGDYERVIVLGSGQSAERSNPDEGLLYLTGRALLKLERYDEARNRFSRILNDGDDNDILDEAYIALADSYYLEGDYEKANARYEEAIEYFPESDSIAEAYYKLGECCLKSGNNAASKEYYSKLLNGYPDSLEAGLLAGEGRDFALYSVQVGSFAEWKNAKKLYDELTKGGFEANIHTAIIGDSYFYRVRVGRYGRRSDAEGAARALQNRGYSVKIFP